MYLVVLDTPFCGCSLAIHNCVKCKVNTLFCSVITELGRTARMYSELALRTEPTVLDVQSALIDSGRKFL